MHKNGKNDNHCCSSRVAFQLLPVQAVRSGPCMTFAHQHVSVIRRQFEIICYFLELIHLLPQLFNSGQIFPWWNWTYGNVKCFVFLIYYKLNNVCFPVYLWLCLLVWVMPNCAFLKSKLIRGLDQGSPEGALIHASSPASATMRCAIARDCRETFSTSMVNVCYSTVLTTPWMEFVERPLVRREKYIYLTWGIYVPRSVHGLGCFMSAFCCSLSPVFFSKCHCKIAGFIFVCAKLLFCFIDLAFDSCNSLVTP